MNRIKVLRPNGRIPANAITSTHAMYVKGGRAHAGDCDRAVFWRRKDKTPTLMTWGNNFTRAQVEKQAGRTFVFNGPGLNGEDYFEAVLEASNG